MVLSILYRLSAELQLHAGAQDDSRSASQLAASLSKDLPMLPQALAAATELLSACLGDGDMPTLKRIMEARSAHLLLRLGLLLGLCAVAPAHEFGECGRMRTAQIHVRGCRPCSAPAKHHQAQSDATLHQAAAYCAALQAAQGLMPVWWPGCQEQAQGGPCRGRLQGPQSAVVRCTCSRGAALCLPVAGRALG